ncbi:MAG: Gfo/Idh/MocA family oxidoreductase, partial [Planctomycetes bacterium]|nr:Gfo/Idh/MocA family oxidoreductase [Planctomycetota bacterium]
MKQVKVAVVGCGGISRAHINGHMNCPQSNLMYCCDIDEEKAKEKAEAAGCQAVTNWLDIIDEVDAVDICTAPHLHAEMTIEAAKRGKHVLCEKIMARDLDEAEAMIKATEKAGIVFMVAFVLRYRKEWQVVNEICNSGKLGQIFQGYCQTSMFLGRIAEWRADPKKFPMGAFLSHGCHYVDQLQWNIGRITHATTLSNNFTFGDQIIGDDTSVAIFRHENGAVSSYVESWAIPCPTTGLRFDAYGTKGSVKLEYIRGTGARVVDLWTKDGGHERVFEWDPTKKDLDDVFGGAKDMHGQIDHFIK